MLTKNVVWKVHISFLFFLFAIRGVFGSSHLLLTGYGNHENFGMLSSASYDVLFLSRWNANHGGWSGEYLGF